MHYSLLLQSRIVTPIRGHDIHLPLKSPRWKCELLNLLESIYITTYDEGDTPLFSNAWYPLHADLCGLDLSIRTTTYTTTPAALLNTANKGPTGGVTSPEKKLLHGDASGT